MILKDCHFAAERAIIIIGKSVKILSCTMNAKHLTIIASESLTINGQNMGVESMIITDKRGYQEGPTSMYAERIELAKIGDWEMQIPKQLLSERIVSSSLILSGKIPLGALDMDSNILRIIFEYLDEESLRALSVVNHQMMEFTIRFVREKRKKGFQELYQEFQGLHHDRELCNIALDLEKSKNLKAINKVCIENLKGACGIVIRDLLPHRAFLQLYFPKECFEKGYHQFCLQYAIEKVEKKEQVALCRKDAEIDLLGRLPCVFWSIPVQLGLVFLAIENGWLLAMPMLFMVIGECLLIIRGTDFNNH
ncbi:MAG: hypothetical protein KDK71_05650 [Chlamydiia bacterium]|nr:hypothetical protein [Chlamydiia bacterium]